jgi:glyoxylase-like metal-dependent hydrolase (beta-lactamase superfamily II)
MSDFEIVSKETGPIKTNCYLLYDVVKKEAALFDVGGEIKELLEIIEQKELVVKYIFCTHLHFDHVLEVGEIREVFPKAKLVYHKAEEKTLRSLGPFARMFGFKPKSLGECDIYAKDGDRFNVGEIDLLSILSPGHTPGSLCYYFDGHLFSGDVLFKSGIGRTDLPGGKYGILLKSIKKLYDLPDETKVYPGHGPITTIGEEKVGNPFISIRDFD